MEKMTADDGWVTEVIVASVVSLCGLLGSAVVILSFIMFKEVRTFFSRLVLCVSLASFLLDSTFLITVVTDLNPWFDKLAQEKWSPKFSEIWCRIQGSLIIYWTFVQMYWNLVIAFHLFLLHVVQMKKEKYCKFEYAYHFFCWVTPAIPPFVFIFIKGIYGHNPKEGMWPHQCTISDDYYWLDSLEYAHIWFIYILSFIFYVCILHKIRTRKLKTLSSYELAQMRPGILYIAAFFICWIFPTVDVLVEHLTKGNSPLWLRCLHAVTGARSNGVLTCIIYGATQKGSFPSSIDLVLQRRTSTKFFISYLIDELSAENIFFYIEVEKYKYLHEKLQKLIQSASTSTTTFPSPAPSVVQHEHPALFSVAHQQLLNAIKNNSREQKERDLRSKINETALSIYYRYIGSDDTNGESDDAATSNGPVLELNLAQDTIGRIRNRITAMSNVIRPPRSPTIAVPAPVDWSHEAEMIQSPPPTLQKVRFGTITKLRNNDDDDDEEGGDINHDGVAAQTPTKSTESRFPESVYDADIFDEAQRIVLVSMMKDVFPRFMASSKYTQLVEQLAAEESSSQRLLFKEIYNRMKTRRKALYMDKTPCNMVLFYLCGCWIFFKSKQRRSPPAAIKKAHIAANDPYSVALIDKSDIADTHAVIDMEEDIRCVRVTDKKIFAFVDEHMEQYIKRTKELNDVFGGASFFGGKDYKDDGAYVAFGGGARRCSSSSNNSKKKNHSDRYSTRGRIRSGALFASSAPTDFGMFGSNGGYNTTSSSNNNHPASSAPPAAAITDAKRSNLSGSSSSSADYYADFIGSNHQHHHSNNSNSNRSSVSSYFSLFLAGTAKRMSHSFNIFRDSGRLQAAHNANNWADTDEAY